MKGSLVIAERELPGILRSRQTVWIFLAVAVGFAATVLFKWPAGAMSDLSGTQSRGAFRSLGLAMLTAVVLIVPAFPATSLVREIKRRTMELLLNSPLQRYELYFGKLIALLAFIVLLLLITLPAMTCCYAMGGISLVADIGSLYGLILVVAVELAVLGLLVGTVATSPESALRWAYGATFSLVIVTLIPWQFLQGTEGYLGTLATYLKDLSPVPAVLQLLGDSSMATSGVIEKNNLAIPYLITAALFVVVGSAVCISRFSYSLMDRSRSQGIITDDRTSGQQTARKLFFLVDPQKRSTGISNLLNPVMVKEFQCRQFGRLHWLLRLIAICAVLSLGLTLATTMGSEDWGVERIGAIIIYAQVALILLLTPGISGGIIAGEMENGGWNLLRTTPLRASKILRGKLVSVVITLGLVLCASLPGYAVIMTIKPSLAAQVTQVIISLVMCALVAMTVSAAVSSFFRTTAAATTVSYGILITLFIGTMIFWANLNAPFSHSFVEKVLSINPMAGALNAIQAEGFESFNLVPITWYTSGAICVAMLVLLQARLWRLCQPD